LWIEYSKSISVDYLVAGSLMDDIIQELKDAVKNYDPEAAEEAARRVIDEGLDPVEAIEKGLTGDLREIGAKFGTGEIWFIDLMAAANTVQAAIQVLEPEIKRRGIKQKTMGKFLIGTVAGDIHDIGKNIVVLLLMANGFEVIDIGVDIPTDVFVEKVKEIKPDILGLSSLLTSSMPQQKKVIDALTENGIRDTVKVIIGGAAVSEKWAREIGADGYAEDAVDAIKVAMTLISGEKDS
jgi:corrinoid protein of di/trimethylamine methyltransferase